MGDISALFFYVAVVEWNDLLALGRPKWPHGHRLAAIGKGSGYRGKGKSEQPNLSFMHTLMRYLECPQAAMRLDTHILGTVFHRYR
jgi:hypothetical protein